jgi:predicted DNA-binding protein (MmcQ/YjbR family)
MNIEFIRAHCLTLPHATEQVQWGDDLVFKIAGKMFAGAPLIPARIALSFKCTPEEFAELVEHPGVIPAPYLARAHWVALETHDALPPAEIKRLLTRSYELVFAKLPKKTQIELSKKTPHLNTAHNGPPTAACALPKPARAASATRK